MVIICNLTDPLTNQLPYMLNFCVILYIQKMLFSYTLQHYHYFQPSLEIYIRPIFSPKKYVNS